jgi:UDP-3-O-acyl-N-acetylglucosamine deacetylase
MLKNLGLAKGGSIKNTIIGEQKEMTPKTDGARVARQHAHR